MLLLTALPAAPAPYALVDAFYENGQFYVQLYPVSEARLPGRHPGRDAEPWLSAEATSLAGVEQQLAEACLTLALLGGEPLRATLLAEQAEDEWEAGYAQRRAAQGERERWEAACDSHWAWGNPDAMRPTPPGEWDEEPVAARPARRPPAPGRVLPCWPAPLARPNAWALAA